MYTPIFICVDVSLSTGGGRKACDWDPMLADYLSTRNKYSIDDEDVESAVHGYSKELCVCFFIPPTVHLRQCTKKWV